MTKQRRNNPGECAKLEKSAEAIMAQTDELQRSIENARSIIEDAKRDPVYLGALGTSKENADDVLSADQVADNENEKAEDDVIDVYELLEHNGDLATEDEDADKDEDFAKVEGEVIPFITVMPENETEEDQREIGHIQAYEDALDTMDDQLQVLRQEFWHKINQLMENHPDSNLLKKLTARDLEKLGPVKSKLIKKA